MGHEDVLNKNISIKDILGAVVGVFAFLGGVCDPNFS